MVIEIDTMSSDPIYQQIRLQIIAAIASGELEEGDQLPSIRSLAADLGINFHTVHEAYGVLRDEGYLVMRGRAGAIVADRTLTSIQHRAADEDALMSERLLELALAHKARGGTKRDFLAKATQQAEVAYKSERATTEKPQTVAKEDR